MNKPTQVGFHAVDMDPDGELETNPRHPRPERDTFRPLSGDVELLLNKCLDQPMFTREAETNSWILANTFEAVAPDNFGNRWIVPCARGVVVNMTYIVKTGRVISACVAAAINANRSIVKLAMAGGSSPIELGRCDDRTMKDIFARFHERDASPVEAS